MNNIDMRNLKLHKLLYNKIDFLNNINKAVGELPFEIINYIMENNFYIDDNFCNYFVLDYLFDFNKSCIRFVDIFYVHKDRMKKIYNHFENNYNYDFYCTVNYEIKNIQNKISKMREKNRKKIYFPDLERLLFIHDKILTEINYLCMIDNLKNNLPIGIIYNISKFI